MVRVKKRIFKNTIFHAGYRFYGKYGDVLDTGAIICCYLLCRMEYRWRFWLVDTPMRRYLWKCFLRLLWETQYGSQVRNWLDLTDWINLSHYVHWKKPNSVPSFRSWNHKKWLVWYNTIGVPAAPAGSLHLPPALKKHARDVCFSGLRLCSGVEEFGRLLRLIGQQLLLLVEHCRFQQ